MIGKIFCLIIGFFVGTFFGYTILEKTIKFLVERFAG